ncbi:MAG: methyltransferase domain-containing protein [Acidobacteriota bacterium]|nr:methyltransferase domain-containing protein [Acidobacteriota bacterium]
MSAPDRGGRPMTAIERLHQVRFSFAPERVLSTSMKFDVFSYIAAGKKTVAEIAAAAGTSERGMRMLLNALVGLELLEKHEGRYEVPPDLARYLVKESPEYLGEFFATDLLWNAWGHLADAVREGKPWRSASEQAVAEEFFPVLVRTLHITNAAPAQKLAPQLVAGAKGGLRVLDIGCGSAVWSIPIAKADPKARITAFDFPKVLETTRQFAEREGVGDRVEYLAGDLRVAKFPERRYDIAILGNIIHGEGEASARDLLARVYRALDSGGRLVIVDMIPNDERTGAVYPLLFALNMLVNTDQGDTYTLPEYREWINGAGFARIDTLDIGLNSPALVATKA